MGKVRIKSFDETENKEQEAKKKAKREAKKAQKAQEKEAKKTEQKPEAISEVEAKTEEVPAEETTEPASTPKKSEEAEQPKKEKKEKFITKKKTSARTSSNKKLVSKSQSYPLEKAVNLLTQFKKGKFDESIELHLNVKEKGLAGSVSLPHGTGKDRKIKVADDSLIAEIEKGNIDFDVLVATPDMMPKLAKVAKILGPRGLMPNPKNGTVTQDPDDTVKRLSGGEINYKTESKAPIIHMMVGKLSFGEDKIKENAKTAIETVGQNKIKSATLTSTMSPGIKISLSN